MKQKTDRQVQGDVIRSTLFVAGSEPNSKKAISVLKRLCGIHLKDRCKIRIVDVYENYQAAIDHNVVMVPTLIVEKSSSRQVIIGSLTDERKVLSALGFAEEKGRK